MTRDQDVLIAKAMGISLGSLCPFCDRLETCFPDVVDFNTSDGSWKILDYVRENFFDDNRFVDQFIRHLYDGLRLSGLQGNTNCLTQTIGLLTPSLIKQAAYEAAKECME